MKPSKFIEQKPLGNFFQRIWSYFVSKTLYRSIASKIPFEILFSNNTIIYNTPHANQSNKELKYAFNQVFHRLNIYGKSFDNVLILGFGLGSTIQLLQEKCQIKYITAIESNQELLEVLQRYYVIENINIVHQDASHWASPQHFDLIIIDIFDDTKIPTSILTLDFIQKNIDRLSPKGILIWNTLSTFDKQYDPLKSLFSSEFEVLGGNQFLIYSKPDVKIS